MRRAAPAPGSAEKSSRSLGGTLRIDAGARLVTSVAVPQSPSLRDPAQPRCAPCGHRLSAACRVARIRQLAVHMYALIVPVVLPFVLLGIVMGLSWWEDHVLPPSEAPAQTPAEAPSTPAARPTRHNPPAILPR